MRLKRLTLTWLNRSYRSWWPLALFGRIGRKERLFIRFPPGNTDRYGRLVPATIRLPRTSCLRSRYADALDALSPGCCDNADLRHYGVMAISMRRLIGPIKALAGNASANGTDFYRNLTITAKHVPISGCFAHSELDCFRVLPSLLELDQNSLTDVEKTGLRFAIAGCADVVVQPPG